MSNDFQQQMTGQSDFYRQISDGKKLLQILAAGLFVVTIITILQDLIHSRLNNYSFYLSESLLFKTLWFLFLPLLFLQFKVLKQIKPESVIHKGSAVLIPTLIHLFLVPFVVFAFSAAFYSHTFSYFQTLNYTVSEDAYKLLLVYGLSVFLYRYFLVDEKKEVEEKAEIKPTVLENIIIVNGRKYTPVSVSDILYLSAATPYVAIQLENKRFLHNETLKSINEKLDKTKFVRVHKSTIVNIEKIVSYKSRLNGDYDLWLENGEEIRLSRNYRTEFKKHFKNFPQVNQ